MSRFDWLSGEIHPGLCGRRETRWQGKKNNNNKSAFVPPDLTVPHCVSLCHSHTHTLYTFIWNVNQTHLSLCITTLRAASISGVKSISLWLRLSQQWAAPLQQKTQMSHAETHSVVAFWQSCKQTNGLSIVMLLRSLKGKFTQKKWYIFEASQKNNSTTEADLRPLKMAKIVWHNPSTPVASWSNIWSGKTLFSSFLKGKIVRACMRIEDVHCVFWNQFGMFGLPETWIYVRRPARHLFVCLFQRMLQHLSCSDAPEMFCGWNFQSEGGWLENDWMCLFQENITLNCPLVSFI